MEKGTPKRVLVSVTDKSNLADLKPLADLGWEFISTSGTAKRLTELGIPVTLIESVTGFPEMMDGRLKTLHPKIFGGILADRTKLEHTRAINDQGIEPIDMVVVNLYDFNAEPSVERIDIGGPSLLRAAAKNAGSVAVLCDPDNYKDVVEEIAGTGTLSWKTRQGLAWWAILHTSHYDEMISEWLHKKLKAGEPVFPEDTTVDQTIASKSDEEFPQTHPPDDSDQPIPPDDDQSSTQTEIT